MSSVDRRRSDTAAATQAQTGKGINALNMTLAHPRGLAESRTQRIPPSPWLHPHRCEDAPAPLGAISSAVLSVCRPPLDHWRGYFLLAKDVLFNPADDQKPYSLIFDLTTWTRIDPIPVKRFRGFRHLEEMPAWSFCWARRGLHSGLHQLISSFVRKAS